ncbi:unnamed protein product [Urochloa decumbens]|uniref:cytokinin dehydrogenase n=1 Tax=Urochloa decumbens TaxID=240449 RepID=A0ABC9A1E3_9POAL
MATTRFVGLFALTIFLCLAAGELLRPSMAADAGGLPRDLFSLGIASRICTDRNSTARASTDFGHMFEATPEAVLLPATPADIADLILFSASSPAPFPVAALGKGHSGRGQTLVPGGVVVDMRALGRGGGAPRINVSAAGAGADAAAAPYVDAGGEQLWADVLRAALEHGLAPRVCTDYLHLTVGGTLSNAGIGGQAFRHGPQIANVHELDVITGTGEMVTCSRAKNSELFFAVLGGLGQFGKMEALLRQLSFEPGFVFAKDVTYVQFLERVCEEERVLRSAGVWDVPHPWLNLFIPRSRILDFDAGVFKCIFRDANPAGRILMYPMNKDRWDDRMTTATPNDDVFYNVALLWSALSANDVEQLHRDNKAVIAFCEKAGIGYKQYLPHHTSQDGWLQHFGVKWSKIIELKAKYDPKAILSPGQRMFLSSLANAATRAVA